MRSQAGRFADLARLGCAELALTCGLMTCAYAGKWRSARRTASGGSSKRGVCYGRMLHMHSTTSGSSAVAASVPCIAEPRRVRIQHKQSAPASTAGPAARALCTGSTLGSHRRLPAALLPVMRVQHGTSRTGRVAVRGMHPLCGSSTAGRAHHLGQVVDACLSQNLVAQHAGHVLCARGVSRAAATVLGHLAGATGRATCRARCCSRGRRRMSERCAAERPAGCGQAPRRAAAHATPPAAPLTDLPAPAARESSLHACACTLRNATAVVVSSDVSPRGAKRASADATHSSTSHTTPAPARSIASSHSPAASTAA